MIGARACVLTCAIALLLAGAWWSPAPASHVGTDHGRPVPQQTHRVGERGYDVMPAQDAHLQPSRPGRRSVFQAHHLATPARIPSGSAAPATSAPLVASGPQLYGGLDKPGMNAAGNGVNQLSPPDSTGAIGPNNYVEMDNANIAVYDRSLNLVNTASIDSFTGFAGVPFCDPQVQWDDAASRWLMSFLYCNVGDTTGQAFLFAWSATADPSNLSLCAHGVSGCTAWCAFAVLSGQYFHDFDKLGHSAGWLAIGSNVYDLAASGMPLITSQLHWYRLPSPGDTSCAPPTVSGSASLVNGDGSQAFTPVPVNSTSPAGDTWIVSAYDAGGNVTLTPQHLLSTWNLSSGGLLTQHPDVDVLTLYSKPVDASELGSSDTIDTLDTRLTQAVGNPTTGIYTQHTVSDGAGHSEVDWYELGLSGGGLGLTDHGSIVTGGAWTFNAAISPRWDGQGAAIVYNVSSASQDPSIVTQVRRPTTPAGSFEPGRTVIATSSAADTDFTCTPAFGGPPCRWGDYSGLTPDPVHQTIIWGTSEVIPSNAGTNATWSDQNFAIHAVLQPLAPGAVAARSDGRNSAALSWTPPANLETDPCPSYVIDGYIGVTHSFNTTVTGLANGAEATGLQSGQTYTFTVTAQNCGVVGIASAASAPVTISGINPAPPASPSPRSPVNPGPAPTPQGR